MARSEAGVSEWIFPEQATQKDPPEQAALAGKSSCWRDISTTTRDAWAPENPRSCRSLNLPDPLSNEPLKWVLSRFRTRILSRWPLPVRWWLCFS